MREQKVLALFILYHRTQQGLSCRELGEKSGVMGSTIGHIESERNSTTFKVACMVLKGLGKTFTDLDTFIKECSFFRDAPCVWEQNI